MYKVNATSPFVMPSLLHSPYLFGDFMASGDGEM